jgi:hypothetical protein
LACPRQGGGENSNLLTHGWVGVCELIASQAMSQNKHEAPRYGLGDAATAVEKERYLSDLEGWMAGHSAADGHGVGEEEDEATPLRRVANMHWRAALDHALMSGIGRPLAAFMPKLRLQRLGQDEIRHFVDDADLRRMAGWGSQGLCVQARHRGWIRGDAEGVRRGRRGGLPA